MISQTTVCIFEMCKGGNTVKNDGGAKMVVVFTIIERNYSF